MLGRRAKALRVLGPHHDQNIRNNNKNHTNNNIRLTRINNNRRTNYRNSNHDTADDSNDLKSKNNRDNSLHRNPKPPFYGHLDRHPAAQLLCKTCVRQAMGGAAGLYTFK